MLYLTPEEAQLVGGRAARTPPSAVVGFGLDPATPVPAGREILARRGVPEDFVLYVGRVDPNKGCETLFRYFQRHLDQGGRPVRLVLAGRPAMEIPDHPHITGLGFVSAVERDALLAHARLLFMPSPFESLSIVLLEAWNQGRPALVNGHCQVLKGQTLRANGGLYYLSFPEFTRALDLLLAHPEVADRLGQQGRRYVESHYRWPGVMAEIESFLAGLASGASEDVPSPAERRAVPQ
jgi:glycosyltransferase involved in cell wall biosynthesis